MRMNRVEEAMQCTEQSISIEPENAICHYIKGYIQLHMNQLEEAKNSLEQCLQIDPQYADANMHLGFVY